MIVVHTTLPTQEEAFRLSESLLASHRCACIHIVPIESLYMWKGEIHRDKEFRLEIKTLDSLYAELCDTIRRNHPYDVPEIVKISLSDADDTYEAWVENTVFSSKNRSI